MLSWLVAVFFGWHIVFCWTLIRSSAVDFCGNIEGLLYHQDDISDFWVGFDFLTDFKLSLQF